MQVKTYCTGRVNGDKRAFECLDELVRKDLGHNATIHSVTDTMYGDDHTFNPGQNYIIARVVIFSFDNRKRSDLSSQDDKKYFDPLAG